MATTPHVGMASAWKCKSPTARVRAPSTASKSRANTTRTRIRPASWLHSTSLQAMTSLTCGTRGFTLYVHVHRPSGPHGPAKDTHSHRCRSDGQRRGERVAEPRAAPAECGALVIVHPLFLCCPEPMGGCRRVDTFGVDDREPVAVKPRRPELRVAGHWFHVVPADRHRRTFLPGRGSLVVALDGNWR